MPQQQKDARITVIVPVYNTEAFLRKCVDSILTQTYTNLEVLLIDDGSTDSSAAICDEYALHDSRVKTLHLQNGGQGRARNTALDQMNGDYVCFVDSDDWCAPDMCERMLRELLAHGVEMIQFASYKVEGNGRMTFNFSHSQSMTADRLAALKSYIGGGREIIQHAPWAKLYRAALFDGVRFPSMPMDEDSATIYKLIDRCGNVVYDPSPVYYVRVREGSATRQKIGMCNYCKVVCCEEMEAYFTGRSGCGELVRLAAAAQTDAVWNLAAQVYLDPQNTDNTELLAKLRKKAGELKAAHAYRDLKAKLLLNAFLWAPKVFSLMIRAIYKVRKDA